ncbi:Gre1/Sip18 [Kluyveromyces lactis]|nr:Gre1/Sip18 [Kluyveromyces lactis]
MSNILHKFADKLTGDDNNDQRVDEQGNRLNSQQQSHGRQTDMGYSNKPSQQSGMGSMGRGSQQESTGRFDDDELSGGRQTRSKNKMSSQAKDHYDEYDDDFNQGSNTSGGRQKYSSEQMGFETSQGSRQQGGLGSQGLSGQKAGNAHIPGTTSGARTEDYTSRTNPGSGTTGGQRNNQFSNDNW